ncbi:response regulator transcription factor [Pseudoalteromonas xiamenensis]|uniref:response regulator transcription factor n=1 Tax=Pseudoalteromonas xiamenensis TaxID=882626 RepID=UPI0027E4D279|nr:response regulator transcription factor [Pseudoalteromonas xiamenensis]WMN59626.1 response regulator transcription factor [Pseudoalteromonas xiamenensis]
MASIVLVEDDERLARLTAEFLGEHGHSVEIVTSGKAAIGQILRQTPDLVILDVMLPDIDGFAVCKHIRPSYRGPVLFLTAKDNNFDQVKGFELGGDDYVVKPAEPYVLLARIGALLRRTQTLEPQVNVVQLGQLKLVHQARQVYLQEQNIELTTQEYDLLWLLANNAGHVLKRDDIYQRVLNREYDGLDRSIDIRVCKLRKKLGDNISNPQRLLTVWGKGYMCSTTAWDEAIL